MKWEYLYEVFKSNDSANFDEWLNTFGKNGWELISCEGEQVIFKRSLSEKPLKLVKLDKENLSETI